MSTLSITWLLPIMTFCTSALIAWAIAPTAVSLSRTSGLLWCLGWAGAAGAGAAGAGAAGAAGAGAAGAAGAGAAGAGAGGAGAAGAAGAGAAGAGGAGAAGGGAGCIISSSYAVTFPNDVSVASIASIHRWNMFFVGYMPTR